MGKSLFYRATQRGNITDFNITQKDAGLLRDLASRVTLLANEPENTRKRELWKAHASMKSSVPLVICDPENGWNEIVKPECETESARVWEFILRKKLFWLEEMKDDHSLDPDCLEYMMVKHIIWYLLYTAKGASKDQLRETYKRCFSWLQNSFPDWERHLKFNDPEGETLSVRSIIKVCSVLEKMKLLPFVLEVYSYLN